MIRKIIKINEELCNGCGLCILACHEGALGLVDGKVKLLRDDYCDGLGDCLPVCATGAITFEQRDAADYKKENSVTYPSSFSSGCLKTIEHQPKVFETMHNVPKSSRLCQWPVQIKLVSINAPYFEDADLVIAADCVAYAYGSFHEDFMRDKITLIGCPKLDEGDYSEKLTAILKTNHIKSVIVVRMEVPCCLGIENAVKTALKNCGKMIPWQVKTISKDGRLLNV